MDKTPEILLAETVEILHEERKLETTRLNAELRQLRQQALPLTDLAQRLNALIARAEKFFNSSENQNVTEPSVLESVNCCKEFLTSLKQQLAEQTNENTELVSSLMKLTSSAASLTNDLEIIRRNQESFHLRLERLEVGQKDRDQQLKVIEASVEEFLKFRLRILIRREVETTLRDQPEVFLGEFATRSLQSLDSSCRLILSNLVNLNGRINGQELSLQKLKNEFKEIEGTTLVGLADIKKLLYLSQK